MPLYISLYRNVNQFLALLATFFVWNLNLKHNNIFLVGTFCLLQLEKKENYLIVNFSSYTKGIPEFLVNYADIL